MRAIEQFDPYQEDAIRIHMELLAEEGNIVGATAFFERYRARLAREYDVEPSEELIEFANALAKRKGAVASGAKQPAGAVAGSVVAIDAAAGQPGAGRARIPTITVLRASTEPASGQLEQWTSAFCRELVGDLSRFKEWSVIAPAAEPGLFDITRGDLLAELSSLSVDYALVASLSEVAGCSCHQRAPAGLRDQIDAGFRPVPGRLRQLAVGVQRHLQPYRLAHPDQHRDHAVALGG